MLGRMSRHKYFYLKLIWINLILVFTVIAAGAIVRATGSGMGCPDWPTCFGKLIPPTNVDQVSWKPGASFKSGEMIIRDEKLLVAIEDIKTANQFNEGNWKIYEKHDYAIFNPLHTWVEFINRLVTVVLGFPVILMVLFSFFSKHRKRLNILLSFLVLFLIGFQAWLGKIVVDRNLEGTTITYHMIGVFAIILVLMCLVHLNRDRINSFVVPKNFSIVLLAAIILTFVMILIGTQVREEIDAISKLATDRSTWISKLSTTFIVHRSFSWLLLISNGWLLYKSYKSQVKFRKMGLIILLLILEIIVGVSFTHFHMPSVLQPIHIFLAALIFTIQLDLYLSIRFSSSLEEV